MEKYFKNQSEIQMHLKKIGKEYVVVIEAFNGRKWEEDKYCRDKNPWIAYRKAMDYLSNRLFHEKKKQ